MGELYDRGFGFLLGKDARESLWATTAARIERYLTTVEARPVPQQATREAVRAALAEADFATPWAPDTAVAWAADALERFQLHTSHPAYYGVFNPQPSTMSVAADALVAAFNPQLASSASSMFCIEAEDHLVRYFAGKFGFDPGAAEGIFTSGGTEANNTALLAALSERVPGWHEHGVAAAAGPLRVYVTAESHHSIMRGARVVGLGTAVVRVVPVTPSLEMDPAALRALVREDRAAGAVPWMVVGTLGSTSAGVVDPLGELADVAADEGLWFHVDGAWGGAAALLPEFEALCQGLERADSVTLDPHKWLSVSMGTGLYVTRHAGSLRRAFGLEASVYMPDETHDRPTTEPYRQSLQWSRRFAGLKLLLTFLVHGEAGVKDVLRHQVTMGERLRKMLTDDGWAVVNDTPLPVVCFRDTPGGENVAAILAAVNATGATWLTNTVLRYDGLPVLRAGISNFATQPEHLEVLVAALGAARAAL